MSEREVITLLTCACCGAEMSPGEAMDAPLDMTPALYYHRDFQACVAVAMRRYWRKCQHADATTAIVSAAVAADAT